VTGFSFGSVNSGLGVGFGLVHFLGCFPLGSRDEVVAKAVGLIDQFFPIFFRAGDIFEGSGHCIGRIHVLELNLGNLHTGFVLIQNALEPRGKQPRK